MFLLLTPELPCWPQQFQLLAARLTEFVPTPALTPALSPRRGGILRRVLSHRQPSVLRPFSPATHPPAVTSYSPSAKGMNMNSRGCQPTEQRPKTNPTLKGSRHQPSSRAFRIRPSHRQSPTLLFGPFRSLNVLTVAPWVSPTAIHVVRLRRTRTPNIGGNYSFVTLHNEYDSADP
jgi:hypothetical protein